MLGALLAILLSFGGIEPPEGECFLETECCVWAPDDLPCITSEA